GSVRASAVGHASVGAASPGPRAPLLAFVEAGTEGLAGSLTPPSSRRTGSGVPRSTLHAMRGTTTRTAYLRPSRAVPAPRSAFTSSILASLPSGVPAKRTGACLQDAVNAGVDNADNSAAYVA